MKISKYFSLEEFTRSETASKLGMIEQYNPSQEVIENLKKLAVNVADPIREQFGPWSPTNGYRCSKLNEYFRKTIGASKNSKHLTGQAFDETFIKGGKNISHEVFYWLLANRDTVKWTKIIWEKGNVDCPRWLHVEYVEGEKQRVFVKIDGVPGYPNYFETAYYLQHREKGLVK